MSFSINTNVTSLQAQTNLRASSDFQSKTINRVTSGLRIVNSGDDAAGLAIANGLRSDGAVLTQGIRNANDGLSTLQTIDGGMNNISMLLDRARTLATQSSSGTFSGSRTVLNNEFQSVVTEISRQAQAIGMNTGGQFARSLSVFVGGGKDTAGLTNNAASVTNGSVSVDLSLSAVDSKALGLSTFKAAAASGAAATTLATIVGNTATTGTVGSVDFKFFGAGYEGGLVVSALNVSTATSLDDVVASINTAIKTTGSAAGTSAAAFSAAGIVAAKSADGTRIEFSSSTAPFSVSDNAGTTATGKLAAENILGTTAASVQIGAQGDKQVVLNQAADSTGTQVMTFSMVDSTGTLISKDVTLAAGNKAANVAAINTALKAANNDLSKLVATDQDASGTGSITIMGASDFKVYVGATSDAAGLKTTDGTQSAFTNSALNGTAGSVDILSQADAQQAVNALVNAVGSLGTAQAAVGKGQNNFNYAINLAQSQSTNLASAESRIRDADLASEAANLTKAQILIQAGTAALAQANSAPQAILSLLKG